MSSSVTLNLGDTFKATAIYRDAGGTPVNLTTNGIVPSAAARSPDGSTTHDLVVTLANQSTSPGQFTLKGLTSDWTNCIGEWTVLIRYAQAGDVFSAERFGVVLV